MVYQPQSNSSGNPLANLIAQAVVAAITKAAPNYTPLARQANQMAVTKSHSWLPAGHYKEEYGKDKDRF